MSGSIESTAAVADLPTPPPASSPMWSSLALLSFRHAKARESCLPTRFLHVSFETPATESMPAVPVTKEQVWQVFQGFGEVEGVQLAEVQPKEKIVAKKTPSSTAATTHLPPLQPQPTRSFAYVSFKVKHQAAHALHALHQKCSPILPTTRLHIHHAVIRSDADEKSAENTSTPSTNESSVANATAASSSATTSSATIAATSTPVLPRPAGCHVIPSFITASETTPILDSLAYLQRGEVSYGHPRKEEDDFLGLKRPKPIDQILYGPVLEKVHKLEFKKLSPEMSKSTCPVAMLFPNRLTLSILHPGQGIKRSQDSKVFGEALAILNLGPSHTIVELYPVGSDKRKHILYLPAEGLVVLTGPARYEYEFAIPAKTRDILPASMVSNSTAEKDLNLKRSKTTICFLREIVDINAEEATESTSNESTNSSSKSKKSVSSSQDAAEKRIHSTVFRVPSASPQPSASPTASSTTEPDTAVEAEAARMEQLHVQGVYDSIATHFSNTRHTPWPRIEQFVEALEPGLEVADIGCGNGKYMGLNTKIKMRGCDASSKLVQICRERGYDVIEGDILAIPFPSASFDAVICIAVLHHISTPARRALAVRELFRLLRVGGRCLVSAWAFEQDVTSRREFPSQDVLVPWNVPARFVEQNEQAKQIAAQTVEAAKQAAAENQATTASATLATPTTSSSTSSSTSTPAIAHTPLVDPSSGSELVQFQRYCHVYKSGELEALFTDQYKLGVEIEIVEQYYDRGNWCTVIKKLKEV